MCLNTQGFLINEKNMVYWQKLPPIRNIIFEGGGAKALLYPGAIAAFEEYGLLSSLERAAGSSAGAFTATLLAFGMNPAQIRNIANTTNIAELLDPFYKTRRQYAYWFRMMLGTGNLASTFFMGKEARYAFHGNLLLKKMREIIANMVKTHAENYPEILNIISEERLNDPDTAQITFSDLERMREIVPGLCELIITGTNLTDTRLEFFCGRFTPELEIALANRISMSLPLLFAPVKYNGKIMIDGGVLSNLPLQMFSHAPVADPSDTMYVYMEQNMSAVGFSIGSEQTVQLPFSNTKATRTIFEIFIDSYLLSNMGYLDAEEITRIMKYNSGHMIVRLNPIGQQTTDFNISDEKKDTLFQQGYEDAANYIRFFRDEAAFYFKSIDVYDFMQQLYPGNVAKLCHDLANNELDFEFGPEMKFNNEEEVDIRNNIKSIVERYYLAMLKCNDALDQFDAASEKNMMSIGLRLLQGHALELNRICAKEPIEEIYGPSRYPHREFMQTKFESFQLFNSIRKKNDCDPEEKRIIREHVSDAISEVLFLAREYKTYLKHCFSFKRIKKRIKTLEYLISHLVTIKKSAFNNSIEETCNEVLICYQRFNADRRELIISDPLLFFENGILRKSHQFMKKINMIMAELEECLGKHHYSIMLPEHTA